MFAYSRVKKFLASALVLTLAYPSVSLPAFAQETVTAFTYIESDNTDTAQPTELLGEHTDAHTSFVCGFEALPPVIVAGEPFTDLVTLRITNTGDKVLSGAILRESGDGRPFEFADIAVQDLQPGESRSVLVDAHLPLATGEQTLTLELVDTAGTVLSPGCSVRFTVMPPSNDGVCVLQNLPLEVKPGGSYPVTLRVTNTGTKTWKPTTHRIAATSPFSASSALTQTVKPGATATLSWTLRVPPAEGTTPLVVGIADGNAPAFLRCMARDGASLNVDENPDVTASYAGYDNAECSIDSVEIDPTLPESYTAMVTLKNTGTSVFQDPLEPLRGAVHIVPTEGNTTTFTPYALEKPLGRGAVIVTPISFHALPGQQRLSIGFARDGTSVFGSLCSVDLTVPEPIADVTLSSDENSSSEFSSVQSSNALSTPEETESTSSSEVTISTSSSEVTISTSSSDDVMSSSSAASSEEPSSFISSSSSLESESAAQSDVLFESSSQESESSAENNTPVDSDPLPQSSSSEGPLSSINTFFTRIVGIVSAFFIDSFTAFAENLSPDQLIAAAQNEMITLQARRDPLSARLTEVQSARDTLGETGTLERFTSAYKTDRDKLTAYDAEIATLTAQISAIDTDLAAQSVIILQNGGNPWSGTQPDLQASLTRLRTERRTIVNRINAINRDGTGAYANSWNALVTKNPYLINGNLQRNIQGGNEVHFIVDDAAGRGDFILSPTGEALFMNAAGTPTPYGMFPTTMVEDPALFFTQQSFTAFKNMFDALIAAQTAYNSMIAAVETRLGIQSASSASFSSSSSTEPKVENAILWSMDGALGSFAKRTSDSLQLQEREMIASGTGALNLSDTAYDFTKHSSSYLVGPYMGFSNSFSIEGILKATSWQSNPYIASGGNDNGVEWYATVNAGGHLCIGYTGFEFCDTTTVLPVNTWVGFAVVHDDVRDEDRIYVNGSRVTVFTGNTRNSMPVPGTRITTIGRHPNLNGNYNHFDGSMDALRISGVARTEEEILALYHNAVTPVIPDEDPSAGSGITMGISVSESADPASLMVERFHQVMFEQQTILRSAKTTINTTSYLQMPPTDRLKAIDSERTRTTAMQTAMEGQLTLLEGSGSALGSPAITLAVQEAKAVLHFVQRKFEYLDRATALEQGRMTAIQTGTSSDAVLRPDIKLAKSIVETYRPVPSNPDFYAVGTKTFRITSGPSAGNYLSLMPDGSIWEGSKLLGTLPTRYYEEPMLLLGVKEATPASGAVSTDPPLLTTSLSMATDSMGRLSGQMSAMIDNPNEDFTLVLGTDPLMNEVIATIPLNRYAGMLWNTTAIPLSLISYQKDRSKFYVRLADSEGRLLDPVLTFDNGVTTTKSVWIPAALRTTRPEDAIENPSMPLAALNASILDVVDRIESATPPDIASIPVDEAALYDPESWMIASAVLTRLETYVAPLPQPTDDYSRRIGQNLRESDELQELMSTASDILGRVSLTENDRTRYRLALSTMQEHSDRWQRETENLQKAWSGALLGSGITPSQTDLVLFHLENVKDRYFPTTGEMEMRMLQKSVPLAGGSVRINVYRGMMEALPTLLPARHFLRSGMKSTSLRTQGSLTAIDLSMLANQAVGVHFALTVEGKRTATVRWFRGNTEIATDTVKGSAVLDRTDLQGISAVIVQANPISTTAGFSVYPTLTIDDLALRSDPLWTPKNIPALSNATNRFVAMATAMVAMDRGTGRAIKNPFCTSPGTGNVRTYTVNRVTYKDSSCIYYSPLSGPIDQYLLVRYNAFKGAINRVFRVHTVPFSSSYDTLAGLTMGSNERYSVQNGMSLIVYPGTPQRLAFDIAATNMSSMPQVVASATSMEALLDAPDMVVTPNRDYWTLASKSTMKTHGWAIPPSEWQSASPNYDLSDSISTFYTFKNLTGESGPVGLNVHLGYTGTVSDAVLFSGTTTFNAGGTLGLGLQIPAMSDKPTANRRPFLTFSWTLPRGRTQVDVVQTPYIASKSKSQDPSSWSKSDQNALARAMVKVANAAALRGDTSRNYTALSTAAVNILKSNDVNNRGTMITGILNGTYAGGPRESLVAVQPVAPTASGTVLPELEKLASFENVAVEWSRLAANGKNNGVVTVSSDGNDLIYRNRTTKAEILRYSLQGNADPLLQVSTALAFNEDNHGAVVASRSILSAIASFLDPIPTAEASIFGSTFTFVKSLFTGTPQETLSTSCSPTRGILKSGINASSNVQSTCASFQTFSTPAKEAVSVIGDAVKGTMDLAQEKVPLGNITGKTSINLSVTNDNASFSSLATKRIFTFTLGDTSNVIAKLENATSTYTVPSYDPNVVFHTFSLSLQGQSLDQTSPNFLRGGAISRIIKPIPSSVYTLSLSVNAKNNTSSSSSYDLTLDAPAIDINHVNEVVGYLGRENGDKPVKVRLFRAGFDGNGQYTSKNASGVLISISPSLPTWVVSHGKEADPYESPNIKDLAHSLVEKTGTENEVLMIDWGEGAKDGWYASLTDACWLSPTASWLADTFDALKLSPTNMDFIGHSHGTHLGYYTMDQFQTKFSKTAKWNSFAALDPAVNSPILSSCLYSSKNVNFSNVAKNSWAFDSSLIGSNALSDTASVDFKVDSPAILITGAHSDAVWMFSSLVDAGGAAFLTLNNLRNGTLWPYDDRKVHGDPWIKTEYQSTTKYGTTFNRAVPIELFFHELVPQFLTYANTTIANLLPSIP